MSLVNDMLRDLDRRRKESSGGAGSVSLTPAPEPPPEPGQRPIMLYLIVALLVGAGAIAWFWMQQQSGNTRDLDIAPQLVVEPVIEESPPEEVEEENATRELVSLENEVPQVQDELDEIEAELTDTEPAAIALVNQGVETSPPVVSELPNELLAETPAINRDISTTSATESQEEEPNLSNTALLNQVDLQQQPAESVKNAAALSSEERDVLAVQKALQLIADNQTAEAYTTLERQIVENRYAHQTRETYAKLLFADGNYLGALQLADAGLALSPNHPGLKKIKARILISQGNLNEAIQLLIARAPAVDQDLEYHELLATAQLASRDFQGALISYTGLVRQDQGQGKFWYGFAASQDSLGNSNAARQGYSRAVSLSNLSASLRRRSQERLAVLSQ